MPTAMRKSTSKRGGGSSCAAERLREWPRSHAFLAGTALRPGDSRRDGDSGRRRAVSRSADGRDRRKRPAPPRHGGDRGPGAARRAAVRKCCMFLPLLRSVRLAVPDPAAGCARESSKFPPLPSRIRDCRAVAEVAPDVTSVFGGRVYSPAMTTTYEGLAAVLRAACRSEDRRSRASARENGNLVQNLVVLGEPAGVVLGVDEFAVHRDVEDALAAFDEFGFDAPSLPDCRRQTGGVRKVVSNDAVSDRDLHHRLHWEGAPERGCGESDDGGADGTRTRDLRRDRPAFWTN